MTKGLGVDASVSKQKSKTDRAVRRKTAVPPSEFPTGSVPPPPVAAVSPSMAPSLPPINGDEEAALAGPANADGPATPTEEAPVPPMPGPLAALSLEQRIRHLEEAVKLLQQRRAAGPSPTAASDAPAPPPPTAIRLDPAQSPSLPAAPVAVRVPDPPSLAAPSVARGSVLWLWWDTWAEARAIVRMFVDPRYRMARSARLLPLVLVAAILTSSYWVPFASLPVLGGWLVKASDLFLAFLLFKWLGHEARRYRQTSPDLPANLRL